MFLFQCASLSEFNVVVENMKPNTSSLKSIILNTAYLVDLI